MPTPVSYSMWCAGVQSFMLGDCLPTEGFGGNVLRHDNNTRCEAFCLKAICLDRPLLVLCCSTSAVDMQNPHPMS